MNPQAELDTRNLGKLTGAAGALAPIWFLVTLAILAVLHGHFDVSGHQLERFGLLMYLGFFAYGLLTLIFAIGLRAVLPPSRRARAARVLLMVFACGPLLGTFTMGTEHGPPQSWHAALHFAGFLLVTLVPIVALPVFAWAVWRDPRWAGYGWLTLVTAAVITVLVFSPSVPQEGYAVLSGPGSILHLVVLGAWQVRIALHSRRLAPNAG